MGFKGDVLQVPPTTGTTATSAPESPPVAGGGSIIAGRLSSQRPGVSFNKSELCCRAAGSGRPDNPRRSPRPPIPVAQPAATKPERQRNHAWAPGRQAVLNFNPATDKLDFGWMAPVRSTSGLPVPPQSRSSAITTYTLGCRSALSMITSSPRTRHRIQIQQNLITAAQSTPTIVDCEPLWLRAIRVPRHSGSRCRCRRLQARR